MNDQIFTFLRANPVLCTVGLRCVQCLWSIHCQHAGLAGDTRYAG